MTADWDDGNRDFFVNQLVRMIEVCESGAWETAVLDDMGVKPKITYCSHCNNTVTVKTEYCPFCGSRNGW